MGRRRQPIELVVVGAGPVGLLFASRLVRVVEPRDINLRVIDAQPPIRWDPERVDPRVYALSRESQCLLGSLWAGLEKRRASVYRRMRVWEGAAPRPGASIEFDAAELGEPNLGHIVEDSLLRHVLLEDLSNAGVAIALGQGIESLERAGSRWQMKTGDGSTIDADLVIGADGARSRVRSEIGIETIDKDYRQRAIVTHVVTERSHEATAWQRFLPGGPLAFLPLVDGRSSIVWTNTDEDARRLLELSDEDFLVELEAASGGVLGRLGPLTERIAFPLRLSHAVRYTAPGVALIGDAAHAVHPLAGQGMNLGLRDAAMLADTLARALERGEMPGDERILKRYERAQKAHNVGMQLAFDAINEFFGSRLPGWVAPARAAGLGLVDRAGPVKQLLMRRALGIDGARRLAAAGDAG